ncbi:phosphatidylinositol alpha-mannosyltransferase [Arcanobacterium wilhelmae]|uniref:Phosphatidylinositol alpha-mannosyltransferase n=1 Tax=Arcanobacterium wilhelmae TaxID=1803177 RepID=A0ABT9N978_9ACTO|nr:glycosyltransferase family 4 protein [Arcanobacterium wilhelmae]MDP9800070.1 phosphatidylinositol alpha-mannosyltransferase [Arcanobacterium wilhelmae]
MKIGIACGYSWDVPGGVQFHIRDLAKELIARGHEVSVIAPAGPDAELEPFVVSAGSAIPIKYNGSVARLAFGPKVNHRVRTWLRDGEFDVLHVHEPFTPSVSMLALMSASCPVVATFHTAMDTSRMLALASPFIVPLLDKIEARIAVSQEARRTMVQHLGGDAWVIPNGVFVRDLEAERDQRFTGSSTEPTLAFLGRIDEPRKGLGVLAGAFSQVRARFPGVRLFVAGKGDSDAAAELFGSDRDAVTFLGPVSDADKAALLASVDAYIAPNTGGESFGIILVEAMSAGAFIVASDIPAFRAVLGEGEFGAHFANENSADLARVLVEALAAPAQRASIAEAAKAEVWRYDWSSVASQILSVYDTAIASAEGKTRP